MFAIPVGNRYADWYSGTASSDLARYVKGEYGDGGADWFASESHRSNGKRSH